MATTTTNAMQAQIKQRGFMTEREMLTLKSRSNKAQKDLLDYDTINPDGAGTPIAPEWGEKEDILKLYENYLSSESKFKAAFPDYMTRAERAEYTLKKVEEVKSYVQNALLEIIANGELNADYEALRQIYLQYLK